jgi:hypothetical protein
MYDLATSHAAARMQQRAIPPEAIDMLLEFGTPVRCHGADSFAFDHAARRRVAHALDKRTLRRSERYLNAYAVVADNGSLITAAWRTKRLRRA